MWLIVSVEGVSPTLRPVRAGSGEAPLRSSGRPRKRGFEKSAAPPLKLNRERHTKRELGPQSRRESKRAASTRPGCRRGDSLSRSGATPDPAQRAATHSRLRTHTASNVTSAVNPLLKLPHARTARRASPQEMNSDTQNTQAPQTWRTTHARVLRARARLRQLHRQRQVKSSRNG